MSAAAPWVQIAPCGRRTGIDEATSTSQNRSRDRHWEGALTYTRHARKRGQQRGIPRLVIDLLLQFGACVKSHDGTNRHFFDKSTRRSLDAYAGAVSSQLNDYLDVYVVTSADGVVITVGHRTERIGRH